MIQSEPNIQDYAQVVIRRRWIICTVFIVIVVTVLISSLKQTPIYEATTTIRIEHASPQIISIEEVTPLGAGDFYAYKDYYETQYKLLKSRTLLERVVNSLGLQQYTPYEGSDPVKRFSRAVKIEPIKNSQLVEISVEDSSPKMAAMMTNTITDEYIRKNLEQNINTTNQAAEWLSNKIEEQRQRLMEAELELQKYREKYNISILPETTGKAAIEDVKSEYARLQALFANYTQRYTDEHPKMIELRAQIDSLRSRIHGLEGVSTGDKTMEYGVLERKVQTNKQMYENLLTRLEEINLSSTLSLNNITIIDRAIVPEKPIKPNLVLNMVLAVVGGLVLGMGFGFFVDYLDSTVKSQQDVEEILKSHFVGGIPQITEKDDLEKDKIVHLHPNSQIAEIYRHMRTEILFLMPKDSSSKSILVTSAEPQAGKTITSTNLAISLSQTGGKILLADGDLRKPQLHKIFGLKRNYGLCEYLKGEINFEFVIDNTEIENLKVVTSGRTADNPAELIGSLRMVEFIREAKQKFDFLIFDSPPIISVTDAIILADIVDLSIQVIRSGKVHAPVALRAKEKLTNTNTKVLGVILNDVKIQQGDYYKKYYSYYGKYTEKKSTVEKV